MAFLLPVMLVCCGAWVGVTIHLMHFRRNQHRDIVCHCDRCALPSSKDQMTWRLLKLQSSVVQYWSDWHWGLIVAPAMNFCAIFPSKIITSLMLSFCSSIEKYRALAKLATHFFTNSPMKIEVSKATQCTVLRAGLDDNNDTRIATSEANGSV